MPPLILKVVPLAREIKADYDEGTVESLQMHDGSFIKLHKVDKNWDPLNRISAMNAVQNARGKGEILTGLLYMDPDTSDLHDLIQTSERPLNSLTKEDLCPGVNILADINDGLR